MDYVVLPESGIMVMGMVPEGDPCFKGCNASITYAAEIIKVSDMNSSQWWYLRGEGKTLRAEEPRYLCMLLRSGCGFM